MQSPGNERANRKTCGTPCVLPNSPGATAVAIVVLSLGIGANAAIFSVTNAVLFRPLPYKDSGSLVFLWESNVAKAVGLWRLSAADYREYRTQNQVLDQMGAMRFQSSGADGRRDAGTD